MNTNRDERPDARTLFRSAAIALCAAALAMVLFVLPAEYGIDPTGTGKALGLLELGETVAIDDPDEPPTSDRREVTGQYPDIPETFDYYEPDVLGEPFSKGQSKRFRRDSITIELAEFEQVEYKARMRRGDAIVYSWSVAEGIVYSDFHADPGEDSERYPDQYYIRYREAETATDSGSLVAPFDGNHGWYWLNIEAHPVTITLDVAGYHDGIDELFRAFQ